MTNPSDNPRRATIAADLSPTMQGAVEYAKKHGGILNRYPGGFWREPGWSQWNTAGNRYGREFGTPTVQALVTRGVADYSEWKDGKSGRFPVQMTLRATSGTPAIAAGLEGRKP